VRIGASWALAGATCAVALPAAVGAEPVAIANAGFEAVYLAGGAVLAEDAGALSPGEGEFETATVVLTTPGAPAQAGQPLAIRLLMRNQPDVAGVSGLEVDFDRVRLDAVPADGAVPLPPIAVVLAGLALGGSGVARLRRRSRDAGSG
jgi:hypothetical protein